MKRLPAGPLFSKEAVCNPLLPIRVLGCCSQCFQRAICLISTHTNTLAWLTPRYLYLRNPPIAIGHSRWRRSQTINIQEDKGVIQIVTRKPKASPHAVSSGAARSTLRNRTGPRRALGATSKQFKSGYRPDLRRVGIVFTIISLSPLPLSHSLPVNPNAPSRARWNASYLESWVWTCVPDQTNPGQEPIKLLLGHLVMSLSDFV